MQGEFRSDVCRDTFDPMSNYSRVLMQQGRVLLDADWNEQTSILLYALRRLTADFIGPQGGAPNDPQQGNFAVTVAGDALSIADGIYYVDGIRCRNETTTKYTDLPHHQALPTANFLVYLDVWERHITASEDDYILEKALKDVDTATRAKVVWQIRLEENYLDGTKTWSPLPTSLPTDSKGLKAWVAANWKGWLDHWQSEKRGKLTAQASNDAMDNSDVCIASPDASYRGENQLYRVEIHNGGLPLVDPKDVNNPHATFKWARDNRQAEFDILAISTDGSSTTFSLYGAGRDDRLSIQIGDWVEVVDKNSYLADEAQLDTLLQVTGADPLLASVTVSDQSKKSFPGDGDLRLRRWNGQGDIQKGTSQQGVPVKLEDGLQIAFTIEDASAYRTGDYWLIPARVETGVGWPSDGSKPKPLPPHGVEHAYAPLAVVTYKTTGDNESAIYTANDCRHLWSYFTELSVGSTT